MRRPTTGSGVFTTSDAAMVEFGGGTYNLDEGAELALQVFTG